MNRLPVILLMVASTSLGLEVDPQKNFQLRECRRMSWRGDVGSLPLNTLLQQDNLKGKVHSRHRRFIAWPSGSTLSVFQGLSMPVETFNNGYNTLKLYLGFPFTLNLPDGALVFKKGSPEPATGYGAPPISNYGAPTIPPAPAPIPPVTGYGAPPVPAPTSGYGAPPVPAPATGYGAPSRQDWPFFNYFNHDTDSLENYSGGYSSYSSYDPLGPYSKRSLDSQRQVGFEVLENGIENLGLPGKICLQRAVCEVAETPVADLGLIGDILNLFLAAGYGEGAEEMADFVAAEDLGRREGDCESLYPECPLALAGLLQGGLSYLHGGLSAAGLQGSEFL